MAYPWGGVNIDLLRSVLQQHFGVEEKLTNGHVHTMDGPNHQPYWKRGDRFVEPPSGATVAVENLRQIARRLKIEYQELLDACMAADQDR